MENIWIKRAELLAKTAHRGQRYGEFSYLVHLQAVVAVLLRYGIKDHIMLCAGWLHDTLEDTATTYEDLELFFGTRLADIVGAVTEPKGGNRAWRHSQTYPRTRNNPEAVIIKLADRIANVEAGGNKVGMYRKEHAVFKKYLYYDALSPVPEMWNYLDDLLVQVPTYIGSDVVNNMTQADGVR